MHLGLFMPVLNVAMIGSDSFAKEIAKLSDQRDVHTYVHKESASDGSQRIISLIRPSKFPEKLRPLLSALSVARAGIIEVNAIDATFGETLVAFASSNIEDGIFVINPREGEWIDEEQVESLIKQAGLTNWKKAGFDSKELRGLLLQILEESLSSLELEGKLGLIIPVDQFFNVKGIGIVAIGYVQQGTISVHDEVLTLPSNGIANAKSLQVMDDDVQQAVAGDRVGIAMRNAKEEWLGAGTIIVHNPQSDKKDTSSVNHPLHSSNKTWVNLEKSPFQKRKFNVGDVIHISLDLQFIVGRIEKIEGSKMLIIWDAPLLFRKNGTNWALLNQLDTTPRIIGRVTEITPS